MALAGTYYVQALHWDSSSMVAGLAPGLFSVAILTVNNLRDRETDVRTGKKTLAVRLGPTFARIEYVVALLGAAIAVPVVVCLMRGGHWTSCGAMAVLLFALPSVQRVWTSNDGATLNATLASTGKLLLIFSLLYSAGWMI